MLVGGFLARVIFFFIVLRLSLFCGGKSGGFLEKFDFRQFAKEFEMVFGKRLDVPDAPDMLHVVAWWG